ncbi:MAG: DUF3800 domain-containing protein [Rickettsiales bacterium]
MRFEVYCDESNQDIFTQEKRNRLRYMTIGSLWIPADIRADAKRKIRTARERHKKFGEMKWRKVSPASLDFYKEIIDLFFSYGKEMRFRCIAVEADKINWEMHGNNKELGFYKFYYQMLHHWIFDFNEYVIFCDHYTNKNRREAQVLQSCLSHANLSAKIESVQSLASRNIALMQLADILLGVASARMNDSFNKGGAKEELILHTERKLDRDLCPTFKNEEKFNIFKINLGGGW